MMMHLQNCDRRNQAHRIGDSHQPVTDVRSGPGEDYDLVYRIFNGNPVYTTSTHRTCGNAIWYELTDGNWIAGSLIGY